MVSSGWQMEDSTKPAVPPARRCWSGLFFLGADDFVESLLLLFGCGLDEFESLELIIEVDSVCSVTID